jgi:hypothetical protein
MLHVHDNEFMELLVLWETKKLKKLVNKELCTKGSVGSKGKQEKVWRFYHHHALFII